MNYLLSLLQSIGMDGAQVMLGGQGGGARNFGDFAWGEAGFQQILTDLMEQVRRTRLVEYGRLANNFRGSRHRGERGLSQPQTRSSTSSHT
mgnify:CR=1 FL=1